MATQGNWLGRNLNNYKNWHENTAKEKGVHDRFMRAKTLTEARRILFGGHVKKPTHLVNRGIN